MSVVSLVVVGLLVWGVVTSAVVLPRPRRRRLGGALLLLAAAGIALGFGSFHWWRFGNLGGVGLLGLEGCADLDGCTYQTFWETISSGTAEQREEFWADHAAWYATALATTVVAGLAVLSTLLAGIDAVVGRAPSWTSRHALAYSVASLVGAALFTELAPAALESARMGVSAPVAVTGAVLGAVGALAYRASKQP